VTVVTGTHVRRAAMTQLKAALPAQLDALAEPGLPLTPPKTWRRLPDFLDIPEAQSPAVFVTTPGTEGRPVIDADGSSEIVWLVRAYCVVRGRAYEETADRVGLYTAAMRSALLADETLGGLALAVDRINERLDELRTDQTRTIGAGSVTIAYTIAEDLEPGTPVSQISYTTDLLPVL
jgi:hypothetical protein